MHCLELAVALLALACAADDSAPSSASGSGSASGSSGTEDSATSSPMDTTDPTDPNACPPYEGMGNTCPVAQCCTDEGELWMCECPAQCETNCCSYTAQTNYCIGPSGTEQIYTCGAGVAPTAVCPDGQELGAPCDPAVDGTGCCDVEDNDAWQCACDGLQCAWQLEDCSINPSCR